MRTSSRDSVSIREQWRETSEVTNCEDGGVSVRDGGKCAMRDCEMVGNTGDGVIATGGDCEKTSY